MDSLKNPIENSIKIGVLAFQGDVSSHIHAISMTGASAFPVKNSSELALCDGLIIPGGESTTISKLARIFDLFQPLREVISSGLPIFGSCAGMILLADRVLDSAKGQESFGGLDVTVRRNAFGRQIDSFETVIEFGAAEPFLFNAVFIRAPWVEEIGPNVEILAQVGNNPVAIRSKNLFATSFHPELTDDLRIHQYFLREVVLPSMENELAKVARL